MAANYINKAVLLLGSQTQLALVIADSVNFYDLLQDAIILSYYLLVPSGNFRDVMFVAETWQAAGSP